MIPGGFSILWRTMASEVANHLWQSTLFAAVAGLLILALHENHPRVRYWVWLAASLKFLLPFSLLVAFGSHLAPSRAAMPSAGFYIAMNEVGQPFTSTTATPVASAPSSPGSFSFLGFLPEFLSAIWLCGALAVICLWCLRWWRVSSTIRHATPLYEGREAEALRKLQRIFALPKPIRILLSGTSLEPGIFGIVQPTLLWPEGISQRLTDSHLHAILTHELHHVRRRDNLASAVHMFVEALFWFYPLVWWLGAHLVEARERACDQEVLELGADPQIYAESILKVCEFCIESPLPCISGVTGSDLKKRMANIMTRRVFHKLDFARKFLLTAAALLALAVPVFFGLVTPTPTRAQSQAETATAPAFEDVSIKPATVGSGTPMVRLFYTPNGFVANSVTLESLIEDAYGVQKSQISGPADLLNRDRYDIQARIPDSVGAELQHPDLEQALPQRKAMLCALLADRFKLVVHQETKQLPVYVLTVSKNGLKLQEAKSAQAGPYATLSGGPGGNGRMMVVGGGTFTAQDQPISQFVFMLSQQLASPVIDKTGLAGKYDFALQWTPSPNEVAGSEVSEGDSASALSRSSLIAAVDQQLGLKLTPAQSPVETIVIDHVEQPAGN